MNYIKATISEIKTVDNLNIVNFKAGEQGLQMMSLELDKGLQEGTKVILSAKSTNISLLKGSGKGLSISNQLFCKITFLKMGELLCKVELDFEGTKLESVLSKEAALMMELRVNDEVLALIQSNELSIMEVL